MSKQDCIDEVNKILSSISEVSLAYIRDENLEEKAEEWVGVLHGILITLSISAKRRIEASTGD